MIFPHRLRHLLGVESGLNDGLALPFVLVLMAFARRGAPHLLILLGELGLGIALGVGLPWLATKLQGLKILAIASAYDPLFGPKGFASVIYGLLVYQSGIARADEIFHLAAIVIAGSIILHSSTDIARRSRDDDDTG